MGLAGWLLLGLLGGCARHEDAPPVAVVSGQAISPALYDHYVLKMTGVVTAQVPASRRAQLLEDLKRIVAAAQAGAPRVTPDTQQEIELQRLETLAQAAAEAAGALAAPTDEDLRAVYARYTASSPTREYHVAHILVPTADRAAAVIAELQSGGDFARLAAEQSADDSSSRGGDLGWIAPGKLPEVFTSAVGALTIGEYTHAPVHTIYGWHVIRLLGTRPAVVPAFEQVKAQLRVNLLQERYQQFLEASLKAARSGS